MVSTTSRSIEIDNVGNLKMVTMDLTAIANGNTLDIVHMRNVKNGFVNCTTDDQVQFSVSGNTLTFICGATLAGKLTVFGR